MGLLFALLLLVAVQLSSATNIGEASPGILITFLINGILGASMIVRETLRASVSLKQIHWIFFTSFFVIAPLNQYVFGYMPWGFDMPKQLFLTTNFILLLWGVLFCFFTDTRLSTKSERPVGSGYRQFFKGLPNISRAAVCVCLVLSFISLTYFIVFIGLENALARSTAIFEAETQSGSLLINIFVRATPVFSFVFIFVRYRQKGDMKFALLAAFIFLLVVDFPTAMPRYNAAAIYGGLIILIVPALLNHRGLFPLMFFLALVFIFPAINIFRLNEFSLEALFLGISNVLAKLPEGFLTGDYDAYSMVARALYFVEQNGFSWGYQLLGAMLFFVPRSVWTTKPYGSGSLIASSAGQDFTNLSCPLPAEGLINFGFVGLIAFAVVVALFCRRVDSRPRTANKGWLLFWPFLCFFFFFLLRGDLMSGLAYTLGYFAVFGLQLQLVRSFDWIKQFAGGPKQLPGNKGKNTCKKQFPSPNA